VWFKANENLEDDIYSFGFILLEVLVGPSIAKREASVLNATVYIKHVQINWSCNLPITEKQVCKLAQFTFLGCVWVISLINCLLTIGLFIINTYL
jgi:hypothetical protein